MYNLQNIIDALLETPYAKMQDSEHLYVRCPYCGDSRKHLDKAHCGIWIKIGQPLIFHCWICEESGIVNTNFLESLGIYDLSTINQISMFNKAGFGNKPVNSNWMKRSENAIIPAIKDTEINRIRLYYMQNRLGINFTYKSLEYLRVIFSIKDFLNINKITPNEEDKKRINLVEYNCIGFLSSNKELITARNFLNKIDFRYIKYKPFNTSSEYQMYTIPAIVDPMKYNITLHLAEGTFDILGVFFNIMNKEMNNNIYAANNGSGYARTIEYFIKKGFMLNLDIRIYSDSDKNKYYYSNLIERFSPWVKSFRIFYNIKKGEKDFGVPKERIQLQEIVV